MTKMSFIHTIVSRFPHEITIKSESGIKAFETAGNLSSPENRLILGATALMSQPFIDYHNNEVDKETRKVSVARTVAKIIAGTFTGYFIRSACIKSINALTRTSKEIEEMVKKSKKVSKWSTVLIPDKIRENGIFRDFSAEEFENTIRLVKKHRNALGTSLALIVMLFTNFALDVPITKFLTNVLNKRLQKPASQDDFKKGDSK
jgi:hypothetical protein